MSTTPLTDFLATLVDPRILDRFRADPHAVLAEARLPADLVQLILAGHRGAIRVRAVKELEAANLSPLVSPHFGGGEVQQPINVTMNSYTTSTFTSNTYTSSTFVNTHATTIITNNQNTTTTTTNKKIDVDEDIRAIIAESISYFANPPSGDRGQLIVVGSGIRAIGDLTTDAEAQIRTAEKVLYCVADPVMERRLHLLNGSAQSLYGLYGDDKPRERTYQEMVDALLAPVRAGLRVCGVFYGHPGVFAWPTHQAIRVARRDGFRAEMHPGVSAEDCLFADLGLDPSQPGCHSLEATDFLINKRTPDVFSHFLLWQAECAGDSGFRFAGYKRHNFDKLVAKLKCFYPASHPIIIYEAASLPNMDPVIIHTTLETICKEQLTGISTLYLPPLRARRRDTAMMKQLLADS